MQFRCPGADAPHHAFAAAFAAKGMELNAGVRERSLTCGDVSLGVLFWNTIRAIHAVLAPCAFLLIAIGRTTTETVGQSFGAL